MRSRVVTAGALAEIASLFLFSLFLLTQAPAAAAAVKTSDALPAWTAPRAVLHLEEAAEAASRFAGSFFLDELLDIHPVRDALIAWLENFPVKSVSLVRGLMIDDEDTFQGAVRFSEDAQELLAQLAKGEEIEDEEIFMASLLGLPEEESLRELFSLAIEPSFEKEKFYEIEINLSSFPAVFPGGFPGIFADWEFWASVEKSGEEFILLIGSSVEDVEKARGAFKDGKKRMTIQRRAEHANFFQLDDDKKGSLIEDLADGLSFEPETGVSLELSLGLGEDKIDLSLRHNFFDVVFGGANANRPQSAPVLQEPGFKFGGGTPWFAGTAGNFFTENDVIGLLAFIEDAREEKVSEFLKENGIDLSVVLRALRSFGVVLGGDSAVKTADSGETDVPGGYVFLSGEPEGMRELIPLVKTALSSGSETLQAAEREGWDLFYTTGGSEEARKIFPMPFVVGMKDGVLLAGSLDDYALEEDPEIAREDGKDFLRLRPRLLFARLDMDALCSLVLSSSPAWKTIFGKNIFGKGIFDDSLLGELLGPSAPLPAMIRGLMRTLEIKSVTLDTERWDSMDLSLATGYADYETLWRLWRLFRKVTMEGLSTIR